MRQRTYWISIGFLSPDGDDAGVLGEGEFDGYTLEEAIRRAMDVLWDVRLDTTNCKPIVQTARRG